eukprot:TRINITY_DN3512_c0_g1_i1.p7 TRINITY_DN3512_c0_g1~~TRINITY_DN3512_c0_g1_i1.p7  ORF type:complete len:113 (+),score=16.59 TRINITY_DN3512_c0_g1_i1:1101-1439(+)
MQRVVQGVMQGVVQGVVQAAQSWACAASPWSMNRWSSSAPPVRTSAAAPLRVIRRRRRLQLRGGHPLAGVPSSLPHGCAAIDLPRASLAGELQDGRGADATLPAQRRRAPVT